MADPAETMQFTIEDAAGNADSVTLPKGLIDQFAEDGDTPARIVGDIAVTAFAGRAHALVHHSRDEPGETLKAIEAEMLDQFEDRFGVTYGEATGHSH